VLVNVIGWGHVGVARREIYGSGEGMSKVVCVSDAREVGILMCTDTDSK